MSAYNNFQAMSAIPCTTHPTSEISGTCITNIDGVCIKGGVRVGGTTGFSVASVGGGGSQCAAFGLFAASNQRYTHQGWDVVDNANPLRVSRPVL